MVGFTAESTDQVADVTEPSRQQGLGGPQGPMAFLTAADQMGIFLKVPGDNLDET
jgi:hypothetical protein